MNAKKKNLRFRPVTILLMASAIALSAVSAFGENITVGDFSYSYSLSTKEGTMTSYKGSSSNVTIPSSFTVAETYKDDDGETHTRYHTITVTSIGSYVFASKTFITSVSFHNKLKSIGSYAFQGCTSISTISFPSSVTSIGASAFAGSGLVSVSTPASLTSLVASAFRGCANLVEAEINGTDLNLYGATGIFHECPRLRRVKFCEGVVRIPAQGNDRVFSGCTNLVEVSVGAAVTEVPACFLDEGGGKAGISVSFAGRIGSIGYAAFSNANITNISISLENCVIGHRAFDECRADLSCLDFSQVTYIEKNAFQNCVNLCGGIDLAKVTYIGPCAFWGCTRLTSVRTSSKLLSFGCDSVGSQAFRQSGIEYAEIDGTDLDLSAAMGLFRECSSLRRVKFCEGVVRIPAQGNDRVFSGCTNLVEVSVGAAVTEVPACFLDEGGGKAGISVSFAGRIGSIGYAAFSNANITNISISLENCVIGHRAFDECRADLSCLDFSQVTYIEKNAFQNCVNLCGGIDLAKVTYIGPCAFWGCTRLTSVRTSSKLLSFGCDSVGSQAFRQSGIEYAEINGTDLDLSPAKGLFRDCSSLRRVMFGEGVVRIPAQGNDRVFAGCTNLAEVVVGSAVTEVPACFLDEGGRSSGLSVSFAGRIGKIEYAAFSNANITNIEIFLENCSVGYRAFDSCRADLKSVDFTKVTYIGENAFIDCANLSGNINLSNTTYIGPCAFRGCVSIVSVRTSGALTSFGCNSQGSQAFQKSGIIEAEINGTGLDMYEAKGIFRECPRLRRVTFGEGVVRIPAQGNDRVFAGCTNLAEVVVGSAVTEVPACFLDEGGNRSGLTVSFAGKIGKIEYAAFSNENITNISISLENASIGHWAFDGFRADLSCLDFAQVTWIGEEAFRNCANLCGDLNLDRTTYIGVGAFKNCPSLPSVKFGSNLTSIGQYAFSGCVNASSFAFAGSPPSVGSYAFSNVKSGATGTYTAAHAAEWEAVIDSRGCWNGLKMKPSYYTVIYDANNGTGARTTATVEWGEPTPAGDGTFTWEAHYFMGWAFAPDSGSSLGSDDVIPEPQEGNTVTLYGQWATFEPVAADWGTDSITLKATGVSLKEGEDFFLSYCDASAAESDGAHWDYVEDLNKTTDGTGVSFTDTQFSSRLGGIPAVRYRLQIGKSKDDVRATMCCTTRNRHGMFIGFSQYDRKYWRKLAGKQGFYNDARDFRSALVEKGGFSEGNAHFVANNTATTNGIRQMMHKCASDVLPGDLFVFYIATHGGGYRTKVFSLDGDDGAVVTESGLAVYDGMYKAQHLLEDVRKFPAGTAVVNIIKSCHSYEMTGGVDPRGGVNEWLVDCGFGQCLGNVAWITDCDARQSSYTVPEELHSRFGIPFILDGLNGGYADMRLHGTEYAGGNTDGMITFGEIGRYAREFYKGLSDDDPSNVQLENEPLLDRIIVGTRTFMPSMTSPDVPVDVTARSRDMYTLIDWSKTSNATSYWIYRYPVDDPSEWKWIGVAFDNSYEDKTADLNKRYGYRVMALNSGCSAKSGTECRAA